MPCRTITIGQLSYMDCTGVGDRCLSKDLTKPEHIKAIENKWLLQNLRANSARKAKKPKEYVKQYFTMTNSCCARNV